MIKKLSVPEEIAFLEKRESELHSELSEGEKKLLGDHDTVAFGVTKTRISGELDGVCQVLASLRAQLEKQHTAEQKAERVRTAHERRQRVTALTSEVIEQARVVDATLATVAKALSNIAALQAEIGLEGIEHANRLVSRGFVDRALVHHGFRAWIELNGSNSSACPIVQAVAGVTQSVTEELDRQVLEIERS
jgi:hypothetical protein